MLQLDGRLLCQTNIRTLCVYKTFSALADVYCGKAVGEGRVAQTLARSGSTKTGPFHDLRQRPAHAVNPPHYKKKVGNKDTALQQVG